MGSGSPPMNECMGISVRKMSVPTPNIREDFFLQYAKLTKVTG